MFALTIRDGQDTYLDESWPKTAFGSNNNIYIGSSGSSSEQYGVFYFPLSGLPDNAVVQTASLDLTPYLANLVDSMSIGIRRITRNDWSETSGTWEKYDGVNYWTLGGGDTGNPVLLGSIPSTSAKFNISGFKELVEDAINNRNDELHFRISKINPIGSSTARVCSREVAIILWKPTLKINYSLLNIADFDLFIRGRDTSGLLKGAEALFYLPCDDFNEATLNVPWDEHSLKPSFTDAVVISGAKGIGRSFRVSKASGYMDLEGSESICFCTWTNNGSLSIGFSDSTVVIDNGLKYLPVSDPGVLRIDTSGGGLDARFLLPDELNGTIFNDFIFLVCDTRVNVSGNWEARLSVNGEPFQLLMPTGEIAFDWPLTSSNNAFATISAASGTTSGIFDEICLWARHELFTEAELCQLWQLGAIYGDPLNTYTGHAFMASGSFDLFMQVFEIATDNIDLFISGSAVLNDSINLTIGGLTPINDNINLFINGRSPINDNLELFIHGRNTTNDNIDLVVGGLVVVNDNIGLSILAKDIKSYSLNLFVDGTTQENDSLNIFIAGCGVLVDDLDIYVCGVDFKNDEIAFYSHGLQTVGQNVDLFVSGVGDINDNINLFVGGLSESNNDIGIFIFGNYVASDFLDLFAGGLDIVDDNTDLFIGGMNSYDSNFDLWIMVAEMTNSNINLTVNAFNILSNDSNLVIEGCKCFNDSCDLFLMGMINSSMPLLLIGKKTFEPLSCPILDSTASIQIGDDLIQIYQSRIDALINQLGKNIVLNFDPKLDQCQNCFYDPIRKISTGIYKPGGPIPFQRGSQCPYCKARGFLETPVQKCIKALVKFNPRNMENYDISVRKTKNIIRLKTLLDFADDLIKAKTVFVDYANIGALKIVAKMIRSPIPVGLRNSRYCISFWESIDI